MKDKYYQSYDELYDIYPEGYFLNRFARHDSILFRRFASEISIFYLKQEEFAELIKREIYNFELEHRFPLRPDARYFLLTNFLNMIVKPIMYQILQNDQDVAEEELRSYVQTDIKTILNRTLSSRKEVKISGHDIMRSIDQLWPELYSTKMELWG